MIPIPSGRAARIVLLLGAVLLITLLVAACSPITQSGAPGASAAAAASAAPGASGAAATPGAATTAPVPTPLIVQPAALTGDPGQLLAWIFNPLFQAFLILMVGIHSYLAVDMGIAIILTTLIVRTALVPLMRRQMVSMRQMQAIGPEIKELQRRYKNDRLKQQQATSALYKERGINQAGCLVGILPLLLILPMYQVVREGLTAADLTASLTVFGVQVVPLTCPAPPIAIQDAAGAITGYQPCINSTIPWLGGIQASGFGGLIPLPVALPILGAGISIFAIVYTVLQLVASRMALPKHDPTATLDQNARTQRTMALFLPFITLLYGTIIPVGVFIYLIVSTIYQIVQQFLTTGWGGMFPLFGRTPAFAVDHQPRFPVAVATAPTAPSRPAGVPAPNPERSALDRSASANATIRQRGRQGRRGRRR